MYLHYSAISDVGRVRRENQDSGYAGPWLLTVCDGVGGAVRGDLASSTAVQALRKLDQEPDDDLLGQVAGAVHRADDRIAELVEEDPDLNGTSTTATVALFDGTVDPAHDHELTSRLPHHPLGHTGEGAPVLLGCRYTGGRVQLTGVRDGFSSSSCNPPGRSFWKLLVF